ncbi:MULTISPECIES: transporter substrate-binding domain-containing protein [Burkholderia]|uniref:Amino acid ABC transporter substrate-binding protein n=1 Tax=Burkholderia aenigmatica TaxID=2015348 RepID=A0A228I088_9BURK|nr:MULTISPECIES: transporter substrate-binding domain-containing protein [Burkholderia]KER74584.1 amino acid ABC transporter substrate-binding protein [Burkholderia cepacia]MBN3840688.1 transporter substrate-binding domain-containing protein [Burkholderia sp. Ac-20349]MDN7877226.1 transporter substrate-binding domain-containing protein [Burkholderia aenigmatica]OXI35848.1 amino acid ABC transporter substrate-binding protein [Burkholderia aenigmatica]
MNRLSRFSRQIAVCTAVAASLFAATASHAAGPDAWAGVKKAGVLRCGAAVAPPYVMRDPKTGAYSGFFSDLCRDFGQNVLKVKVEFVDTSWDNIVAGLQSDKWDLSLALNDTPEREKAVAFSAPATDYNVSFVYNKNNPRVPKNLRSIADIDKPTLTIAVMSGTSQDKAISAELKQARIMRLPGNDETRLSLISKRADLLADANITNMLLTEAHPDWSASFNPAPPLAQQEVAFGLRKDTPKADLDVLNGYLAQQIKSGAVNRLIKTSVQAMLVPGK